MLDEFLVAAPAGFPDHPHRGFETVTYMFEGTIEHEDSKGHRGKIGPGDLQWMTAAKGIIHAEMPFGDKPCKGLQLWVNLPKTQKMAEPRYQELLNADIPRAHIEGVTVKVIAGESLGVEAKVRTYTPILYVDVDMEPNRAFTQDIPEDYTGFVYVLTGNALFGTNETVGKPHSTLVLGNDGSKLTVRSMSEAARFVIIAGKPIREPIVQHGPFVMNNQKEIYQAIMDYQTSQNGFEAAATWQSEIKH